MRYTLSDAQILAQENPVTFQVPADDLLSRLRVGDYVKICVTTPPPTVGERFWVKLTAVAGVDYRGVINNDLVHTARHGLRCGDTVAFHRQHIYDVLVERR